MPVRRRSQRHQGLSGNARRPSGQVRSAEMQDGHTLKTPSTAIRMATRTAAAPEFPAPATSRFVMLPGALRPEPAGHNCPAPRPNPARPSRQTASCPQTARPARAAGITSWRESWAACRSASASVRTRHCAPTRPPEGAVRGLQNIGYVICALLRPAIAPHTDRAIRARCWRRLIAEDPRLAESVAGQGWRIRSSPRCRIATAPARLAGSARVARSLMALVAADWSARRSTTMPAWLPGG